MNEQKTYMYDSTLKNIDLPETYTKMHDKMFFGCENLETADIQYITKFGDCCFAYCKKLFYVMLNDNLQKIPLKTFFRCIKLKCLNFSKKLKYIGPFAFSSCNSLEVLDLSNTQLETIENSAFYSCKSLKKVIFPKTLKTINDNAFADCSNLETIEISQCNKLKHVGKQCFQNCSKLTKIDLPNSIDFLGEECFESCFNLAKINIPTKTKNLQRAVFGGCRMLYDIELPKTVKKIEGYAFTDTHVNLKQLLVDRQDIKVEKESTGDYGLFSPIFVKE